jgi:hypothetical protein
VQTIVDQPDLAGLRFVLATADAHGLYERFGFEPVDAARMMSAARERGRQPCWEPKSSPRSDAIAVTARPT